MSALPTRSHAAIVATIAAGMQGRIARFLNFATGGIFLGLAEAYAGVCLWLQREITQVQRETRLATSTDKDVDSFIEQFGLERLPAIAAAGIVIFSRYTAGNATAFIPVGAQVRTGDGSLTFQVTADPDIVTFDNGLGGYVVPAQVAQIAVPVACTTLGTIGNVGAGAISLIASDVPGMDTVANAVPFTTGVDAESDGAVQKRFVLFFGSLSKATETAIRYAVASLQQGLQVDVLENRSVDGLFTPGFFYVVIDDGTGNPPDETLTAVYKAIDVVRGESIRFGVGRPQVVFAELHGVITAKDGYDLNSVIGAVGLAWDVFVNRLHRGEALRLGRLYQLAYDAHPGVDIVSNVSITGQAGNFVPTAAQTIRTNTILLS